MGAVAGTIVAALICQFAPSSSLAETTTRSNNDAAAAMGLWGRFTTALEKKSVEIADALQGFPAAATRILEQLAGGRGLLGILEVVGLIALVFALAFGIERLVSPRLRRRSRELLGKGLRGLGQRLAVLAVTAVLDVMEIALFAALAGIGLSIVFASGSLQHDLAVAAGFAVLATRLGAALLRLILSPRNADTRMLPITDDDAAKLLRQGTTTIAFAAAAYFGSGFLALAGLKPVFVNAWFLLLGIVVTISLVRIVWRRQRDTANTGAAALSASPERTKASLVPTHRGFMLVVVIGSWILWSVNNLLDHRQSAIAVLVSAMLILFYPVIDRCIRTLIGWAATRKSEPEAPPATIAAWPLHYRLILLLLRIAIVGLAAIMALEAWGLGVLDALATPLGQRALHALLTLGIAVPLAVMIWHGSQILLERKLGASPKPGDETPGTRAHTLVPILRTFLMIFLFIVVAMMVLVAMGVEIGPLIAGAGIFGVAIGFGSQSLVRDVISGFFFLFDDAFRLGEYIDVGKCKGTVEKISIRSLQLRHHRGALNTIPYGQIASISNYTRDWVIEKLEFGLVYGTDPEKVRKLVKKIGQDQLANPDLAADILEPLKSQGVQRFADSAVVFRAKVKCRPGRQFTVRREAYRKMQEVFAANGIEFAYPTVTLNDAHSEMDHETRTVAAAQVVHGKGPVAA